MLLDGQTIQNHGHGENLRVQPLDRLNRWRERVIESKLASPTGRILLSTSVQAISVNTERPLTYAASRRSV